MYTHHAIWTSIDLIARRKNWSLPQLAAHAGLDATALNPSKRFSREGKPHWPSTATLVKILAASDINFAAFCEILESVAQREAKFELTRGSGEAS